VTQRGIRRLGLLLVALLGFAGACAAEDDAPSGSVHIITATGSVGPIMDRYIDRGIDRAEGSQAKLVVIQLDTPGGLSSSMERIVKRILDANVPVAVYVTPAGGKAASAGTFITMSAHIAAMAPNTRIGAASAVNADGSDIEGALGRKIENDAVAFIRALAELRGRNADWAESAVRDATADNAKDALALGVVDYVAADLDELLSTVDGSTITLRAGTTVELRGLMDAARVETNLTVWERILEVLADPTLATILISLGFLGLVFELSNPGLIFPGVAGLIAIILGFIGFGALPVETGGLILIAVGLTFLALELFVPSGGILGTGGVVALLLGVIIAFRDTPTDLQPNRIVLAVLAFFVVSAFLSITVGLARMRKMGVQTGAETLIGQVAVARTPLAPDGYVFLQGERWRASLERGAAHEGDRLRVTAADGLHLTVAKEEEE
jgi:membrane-bound serine protease (ClpP class)